MSGTVTLGRRSFEVPPLKLGQLRLLLDGLDAMAGKSGGALVEAAAAVIHAGLVGGAPDLTIAAVLDMEATMDEVNLAVAAIIRMAGLVPKEPGPGEAVPVAQTEPTALPASTAPSPPAAATPIR